MKIISDRCKYGVMHWLENYSIIGRSLKLYGEFAEGENKILSRYVSPGSTVVDVGANVGTCTLAEKYLLNILIITGSARSRGMVMQSNWR